MDVAAINVNDAIQLAREGKVRMLAQAAATRQPEAADVPTFRELGFDLVHGASRGIVGPPNMPPAIVARLDTAALASKSRLTARFAGQILAGEI